MSDSPRPSALPARWRVAIVHDWLTGMRGGEKVPWGAEMPLIGRTIQGGQNFSFQEKYEGMVGWIYAPYVGVRGDLNAVSTVAAAGPDVYNHNVETVRRLYPLVRRQGRYEWALEVIRHVAAGFPAAVTKSGLMVGLGEEPGEVEQTLRDLADAGCQVVTVGQYLQPTGREAGVVRYWTPEEFAGVEAFGRSLGVETSAGPFVRSSYNAAEVYAALACLFTHFTQ